MRTPLNLLADFTFDVWLAAKFSPRLSGIAHEGRAWERAVASLLYRPGFTRRQGPGSLSLFGVVTASGVTHELDGAADGRTGSIIVECKATASGISKADAALFHYKVMDFFQRKAAVASHEKWWRIICGTAETSASARAASTSLGLLVCDPNRLPLPVLVRAAGSPAADLHLPETLLQEVVRLGERALQPQQEQWPYNATSGQIAFHVNRWKDNEIRDLMWLEDELSGCLLELYNRRRPGLLEQLASEQFWRLRKAA